MEDDVVRQFWARCWGEITWLLGEGFQSIFSHKLSSDKGDRPGIRPSVSRLGLLISGWALMVGRAGVTHPDTWRRGLALFGMVWMAWAGAAFLNGLPGLRMQPDALLYLPLFVPWKLLPDLYQLRAVASALLLPWLPVLLLGLELVWPGGLGKAVGSWLTKLARAVGELRLEMNLRASAPAVLALVVCVLVAGLAWMRVFSEGHDFNWESVLNLLALLARVALLPVAVLMLRSRLQIMDLTLRGWAR